MDKNNNNNNLPPTQPKGPTNDDFDPTTSTKNKELNLKTSSSTTTTTTTTTPLEPEAVAVLAFLRKRGLGTAALELEKHLDGIDPNSSGNNSSSNTNKKAKLSSKENEEEEAETKRKQGSVSVDEKAIARKVAEAQESKTLLNQATGGRLGYDLDAVSELILWGTKRPTTTSSTGNSTSESKQNNLDDKYDTPNETNKIHIENGSKEDDEQREKQNNVREEIGNNDKSPRNDRERWEQTEATQLVHAFTKLQTWVLTIPNEEHGNHASVGTVLQHAKQSGLETKTTTTALGRNTTESYSVSTQNSLIPSSIKPELLAVCFPLFINVYCELLRSGLESMADAFVSTYRHIHEPYHSEECLDLDKLCSSHEKILHLQTIVNACKETTEELKKAKDTLKSLETQLSKANNQDTSSSSTTTTSSSSSTPPLSTVQKEVLVSKTKSLQTKIAEYKVELRSYPFLHRVLAVKWQLNISSLTFQTLVRFFHSGDHGGIELLPLSALLQSQCHLVVENRKPISYVPGYVLEDMLFVDDDDCDDDNGKITKRAFNAMDVKWAAPTDMNSRLTEAGEGVDTANSILKKSERLPFPSFYLKSSYATIDEYKNDEKRVEFNRALLTNGFRRLEALEAKYEFENGMRTGSKTVTNGATKDTPLVGNPMEPSIMFSTICASTTKSSHHHHERGGSNFPLNESSVDLTCAKLCLPDGRHVAAGCSDSAVRIWSMKSWNGYVGKSTVDSEGGQSPQESSIVLYGHKEGLPIYDIDWNRDGRTLLSAGGDGTIRLWDSKAVGPFGKLTSISKRSVKSTTVSKKANKTVYTEPGTHVPGAKPESLVEQNGSALACYQGHMKLSPIWSVAMAPSGYYFASAGSDSTARLWCTDRPTPVRVLLGHYSRNINCVTWHPNCNYLLTGSDDKTVRMWDVQSGRSVRILSGCKAGINNVKVSPSGQYVAGTDYGGKLSIWDVRNGKKLKEFSCNDDNDSTAIIHSMSYSPCGSTIATGGDDCSIRIWDVRGLSATDGFSHDESAQGRGEPFKIFRTYRSTVLDLQYTKRNLLLSVGRYLQ